MSVQVLIVDDDQLYRQMMLRYFERIKVPVVAVESAQQALAILHDDTCDVSLMLVDIAMPSLNGYDFTRMVRTELQFSQLAIVAVTARERSDVLAHAEEVGIDYVITKPPTLSVIQNLCIEFGLIKPDNGEQQ